MTPPVRRTPRDGRPWAFARGVGAVLIASALAGCGSTPPSYPPGLIFDTRTDRLVLKTPDRPHPTGVNGAGRLDAELAGLDALGGTTLDPAAVPAGVRDGLNRHLRDTFGTPAAPTLGAAAHLGLTPERLTEGGRLYRRHCLQCHGLNGDGRGPTTQYVDMRPRDFRRGSFKFGTAGDGRKPRRSDLLRTITDGLKGTAMPPFALIPAGERELLADYVVFLSVRGQVEFQTLASTTADDGADDDPAGYAGGRLAVAIGEWTRAEAAPPVPTPPADIAVADGPGHETAVRRGYELFTAATGAGCAACHADFGRAAVPRYDVWGTAVRPADLVAGVYKGGGRPADVYVRVRHGIAAAGMPAHPHLSDADVWALVRFVRAVPRPRELPADVREKVYPTGG